MSTEAHADQSASAGTDKNSASASYETSVGASAGAGL